MAGQLRLSETQLSDFRSLVTIPATQMRSILDRLNEITPVPMSQEEVRRVVLGVIPEQARAEALTRQVLALAGLQYRSDRPYDELNQALRSSLEAKFDPPKLAAWDLISPLFNDILTSRDSYDGQVSRASL